jgi:hypothetical protein
MVSSALQLSAPYLMLMIADLIALLKMGKLSIPESYCVKSYVLISATIQDAAWVVTAMEALSR